MIPYKPIEQQFRETAGDIRNNIPRIVIGQNKPMSPNYPNYPNKNICPYCKRPYYNTSMLPTEDEKRDKLFSNIRKWGLWIVISLVLGYAIYRLLDMFFPNFI
jgi:hypothetical protein